MISKNYQEIVDNMNDIFQKRVDLILDYISQILVYGSDTKGTISIDKNQFEDGKYLILTVNVLKNSYFRYHDLGILAKDSLKLYKLVSSSILEKFKTFDIKFIENNTIRISSSVNHNFIDMHFTFTNQKERDWFSKQEELFYNNNK